MMRIVDAEITRVRALPQGTTPSYDRDNPVARVLRLLEDVELAAEGEHYLADSLEYLFPVAALELYGPSDDQWQVRDPRAQENKGDFQKQNIAHFTLGETQLVRGYAAAGAWIGAFLRVSWVPAAGSPLLGPDSVLPGPAVSLYLKVGSTPGELLRVPYDERTHRYEVEIWADPGQDLRPLLGPKGQAALDRGALVVRPSLVRGTLAAFEGPGFDARRDANPGGLTLIDHAPDHTLHPLRPLHVELAWSDAAQTTWDSRGGANYHYEFAMSLRGWRSYLAVGRSGNPHGGVGTLEYRNLYSNYFGHEARRQAAFGAGVLPELGRDLQPFNVDADGRKPPAEARERFLAVDYMDLHVLRPGCSIGIHRHRDNQEAFLLLEGQARMITGDWMQDDARERAFEVRTMRPGDIVLIKGGQLHALVNSRDENAMLFMFGGYD